MNNGALYFRNGLISVLLYLIIYCSLNRYNCIRHKGINLPLGYVNIFKPFIHIIYGRPILGLRMLFSLNTPYLFIMLSLLFTAIVIYREDNDDKDNKNNN